MSSCPACQSPLESRPVMQTEMLCCTRCGGTFLDALSGAVVRVDFGAAFGVHARGTSPSDRRCPNHNAAMSAVQVECASGIAVVHRCTCCTGVFLDAGQAHQLSAPRGGAGPSGPPPGFPGQQSHPAGPPPGFPGGSGFAPPVQFASRPPVSSAGAPTPTCPTCNIATQFSELNGVDVDECGQCGHVFFEKGEPERAGIDTEAIFADGPWAAKRGPSPDIKCVMGHEGSLHHFRGTSLAGDFDAYFASCCHGVWVAEADVPKLRAAARKAVYDRGEYQHMAGQKVQKTRAQATPEEMRRVEFKQIASGMIRGSVDRSKEAIEKGRQRGRDLRRQFDFDGRDN
ncbi:MAG: Zn-finger nucleic acid-binding protein [Polyangiales bacterium]|jgi:Zn-finger nucleic acid-binding protein